MVALSGIDTFSRIFQTYIPSWLAGSLSKPLYQLTKLTNVDHNSTCWLLFSIPTFAMY